MWNMLINWSHLLSAISACAYGVGFAIFLAGGIVYSQQAVEEGSQAEAVTKGDPNFGVSP
jgi:hypothetical protein